MREVKAVVVVLSCHLPSVGAGSHHQSDGACGGVSGVGFNRTAAGEQTLYCRGVQTSFLRGPDLTI